LDEKAYGNQAPPVIVYQIDFVGLNMGVVVGVEKNRPTGGTPTSKVGKVGSLIWVPLLELILGVRISVYTKSQSGRFKR
jgi:hypothetical protein